MGEYDKGLTSNMENYSKEDVESIDKYEKGVTSNMENHSIEDPDLANTIERFLKESQGESVEHENLNNTANNTYTRWYPHMNIGNRSNINNSGTNTKKPKNDLEKYGSYHFEIFFFPEGTALKSSEDDKKARKKLKEKVKNMSMDGQNISLEYLKDSLVSGGQNIWGAIKEYSTGIIESYMSTQNITTDDLIIHAPIMLYSTQKSLKCDIYLPLKKYTTTRKSGITENKNVASDISTSIMLAGAKMVGSYTGGVNPLKNRIGLTMRDMLAPRIDSPNLETLQLEWELTPRSKEEMTHILDILRFFQSASVPVFEKTSLFYKMPPVLFMEAITTDHTKDKVKNLKPKKQYYITSVNIDLAKDADSVILTPDGYPMFITLSVGLIKTDLTNYKELFANPLM